MKTMLPFRFQIRMNLNRRKVISLLLAAVLLLGSIACQATPAEEAVINREETSFENVILATSSPEQTAAPVQHYDIPAHWTEDFALNDSLTVSVDCDILTGSGEEHPIYQISRLSFTDTLVYQTILAVFPDADGIREQEKSREELVRELELAERGAYAGEDDNGNPIWTAYDGQENEIREIQEELEQVPAESTYVALTPENLAIGSGRLFAVRANGEDISVLVNQASSKNYLNMCVCSNANIQPESWVLDGDAIPGEAPHMLENVTISKEEACSLAESVLARLGRTDMALAEFESSKARCLDSWDIVSEGWQLTYVTAVPGTEATSYRSYAGSNGLFHEEEDAYSSPWRQEHISFYITENGIEAFTWENTYSIDATMNADAELLPFTDIQDQVRKQLKYGLSWITDPVGKGYGDRILVTRIVLTTTIAQLKDQQDTACLVPTWAIFYIGSDQQGNGYDESLLLINAIDGSQVKIHS